MRRLFVVAMLMPLLWTDSAPAQLAELLRKAPGSANSIVLIDVDAVHASPIGMREGWKSAHERDFASKPMKVPPEAKLAVITASLDPTREFAANWQLTLLQVSEPFPVRAIARAEGGYVDEINAMPSVWTPSDAYIASPSNDQVVEFSPANRQLFSRWVDFTRDNQTSQLSEYLTSASQAMTRETPFILAIDLKDFAVPHRVREALEESDLAGSANVSVEQIAAVVQTIEGITMKIRLGEQASGEISFDFGVPTAALRPVLRDLVSVALRKQGMDLPDASKWSVVSSNNSIVAKGPLSEVSLRRISSLLEPPTTKFSSLKDVDPSTKPSDDDVAYKSQKYFRSVGVLLDDLDSTLKKTRDNHAVWFERYAKKIDGLPILHVDQELLGWGAAVAETLREMALAKRNSGIRSGVRKSSVYGAYQYDYNGYGYGYGYGNARSSNSVRSQISMEEQGKANAVRFAGWKGIEDSRAEIRVKMTQKYNVEF